jgi:hypothetical protein
MAKDEAPKPTVRLRTDGPTLEEYVERGYDPKTYPPKGYEAKPSPAFARMSAGDVIEPMTHLVVTCKRASFRAGGLTHTPETKVYLLSDLGEANVKDILDTPEMLVARRITATEAKTYETGGEDEDDDGVSKAQLRQWLKRERAERVRLEGELRETLAKLSGADLPPKRAEDAPGMPAQLPPIPTR